MTEKTTAAKATTKTDPILQELLESGAHFGHRTSRWNPKMGEYIFGARGGVHIIDLTLTADGLKSAVAFVESVTQQGKQILFVGTKRQAKGIIEAAAKDSGMPYVTQRWLGGMLTNLETINTRINRLKRLEAQQLDGSLETLTKKERLDISNEIEHLNKIFGGIREMQGLPGAIFVIDMPREEIAIKEARKLAIPVIAITDTNADPDLADYVIPANDDAIRAVSVITGKIAAAAKQGGALYGAKTKQEEVKAEEEVSGS
jgi:small subunit ribosomal protein S2